MQSKTEFFETVKLLENATVWGSDGRPVTPFAPQALLFCSREVSRLDGGQRETRSVVVVVEHLTDAGLDAAENEAVRELKALAEADGFVC